MEGECNFCHSPKIKTPSGLLIPDPNRLLSGHPQDEILPKIPPNFIGPGKWKGLINESATAWAGEWGISYAANLTPDSKTGIGKLTEDNFISILKLGIRADLSREILPPMPWFELSSFDENDLRAIFAYLKSLKPIKNKVPKSIINRQ